MSTVAKPLEAFLVEVVLYRLDTPELGAALTDARRDQHEAAELHKAVAADQEMLEAVAADYANRVMTRSEWLAARDPIQQRIDQNQRRLSRLSPTTAIDQYVGHSDLLRSAWADLPLSRQQAIIRVVVHHVITHPAKPGRGFNPDRFEPVFRL